MKINGFIALIWVPSLNRYSMFGYHEAFVCPATGLALPPSRECFLDEDSIFMPTSLTSAEFWSWYSVNCNRC